MNDAVVSSNPSKTRANPYVGPRSFRLGETLYGRDNEVQDLLGLLIAERIVLLHSPSGAGKTSLMQASLIPQLQERGFFVLPIMRVSTELPEDIVTSTNQSPPNRYVMSALLSLEENVPVEQQIPLSTLAHMSLSDYLHQRMAREEAEEMVLIFDQFEEVLTIDPADQEAKTAFFSQLGEVLRHRRRSAKAKDASYTSVWALFAIREDYIATLDPYLRHIPTRLKNTFRLDLLGPNAAKEAIRQPAALADVTFDEDAAIGLVNDLRRSQMQQADGTMREVYGPHVEPVQLQVVCYRLWENLPPDKTSIQVSDTEALGDVDTALANFYAECVASTAKSTGVPERFIRDWFQRQLITPQGIRGQILQEDSQSKGLDNHAIFTLIDFHIVRAEKRRGSNWFELAHDRLIAPVQADNERWFEQHLSALQRNAVLWESQGNPDSLLLEDEDLAQAETWLTSYEGELTAIEQEYVQKCRDQQQIRERERRNNRMIRYLAIGATVISIVALVALWVAVQQTNRAEAESERAEQEYRKALAGKLMSDASIHAEKSLDLALLLSVAANEVDDTWDTRGSMLDTLQYSPHLQAYLRGHNHQVVSVAYSPDGNLIASGSYGDIILWDTTSNQPIGEPLQTGFDEVYWLDFSPDGRILAAASSYTGQILLWDVQTHTQGDELLYEDGEGTWKIAFSPDGKLLAATYDTGMVILWDMETREPTFLEGHTNAAQTLAFSSDGAILASAGSEGTILFWDTKTHQQRAKSLRHSQEDAYPEVWALAFSPDGKWLASVGSNAKVVLWDAKTLQVVESFQIAASYMLIFGPDSRYLALGTTEQTIVLFDIEDRSLDTTLSGISSNVNSLAFSPDGTILVSGNQDNTVVRWRMEDAKSRMAELLEGHTGQVWSVAFSNDGTMAATAGEDSSIQLWDVASHQPIGEPLIGLKGLVRSIVFHPDDTILASSSCGVFDDDDNCVQGEVRFWDVETHQQIGDPIPSNMVIDMYTPSIAFSSDGHMLASAGCGMLNNESGDCEQGSIILWDSESHEQLGEPILGHTQEIWDIDFSPDGKVLASGGKDNVVRLWDVATHQPVGQPLEGHTEFIWCITFNGNGSLLASGSRDTTVRVWDMASYEQVGLLSGHEGSVFGVAFSPDNRMLASVGWDGSLRLWDVTTKLPINENPVPSFAGRLTGAVFSPDGKTLLVGAEDPPVAQLWDVDPVSWREHACQLVGRNLTEEEWAKYLPNEPYRTLCP